jgi:hypothetical protein
VWILTPLCVVLLEKLRVFQLAKLWKQKAHYHGVTEEPARPPGESSLPLHSVSEVPFSIILPSTNRSPNWPLSFQVFGLKSGIHFSSLSCVLHVYLILLSLFTHETCKLWNSTLFSAVQSAVTSAFLGPNILLNNPFSYTLCLCSSL